MDNIGHEDETREFKESTVELKDGINSLVAMLNKNSKGEVLFGVRDNGDVIGQDIGKQTLRSISQSVSNLIDPPIVPKIEILTSSDDRLYISVSAVGNNRPYFSQGIVYIRSGEENRKAPASEIRRMILSTGDPIVEESSREQNLSFKDLGSILSARGINPGTDERMHVSLGLLNSSGKFNLMAQLLSDQDPFPLTVVVFSGKDRSTISNRKDFMNGSLLSRVLRALEYVDSLNSKTADMSGPIRIDRDMFDPFAFREAWINACVHNNWLTHIPPTVHIFEDRMEIISTGGIPYWLSENEFFSGHSMPVNESLMRIFIMSGLSEHTGHGVPIIIKSCGRDSYRLDGGSVRVTLPFMSSRPVISDRRSECSRSELLIIDALSEHPDYTLAKIAKITGLSVSTVSKIVPELSRRGIIERQGSNKSGKWIIKNKTRR